MNHVHTPITTLASGTSISVPIYITRDPDNIVLIKSFHVSSTGRFKFTLLSGSTVIMILYTSDTTFNVESHFDREVNPMDNLRIFVQNLDRISVDAHVFLNYEDTYQKYSNQFHSSLENHLT
jgi:hypothetical protein